MLGVQPRENPALPGVGEYVDCPPANWKRLIALMQTPHRFRSKRQLWTYSGLGIETHDSAQYRFMSGQLQRSKKPQQIRGLNRNHNHEMKANFKSAATRASCGHCRERALSDWINRRDPHESKLPRECERLRYDVSIHFLP